MMGHRILSRRDVERGLVAAVAGLVGLANPVTAQQKRLRVAFANVSDEIPFSAAVLRGFKDTAPKFPDVELGYFDNKGDAAKSVENARTAVAARYDVYMNYGISPAANVQIARILEEAGIPAIAITVPLKGAPLFAVDNKESGSESGERLAEAAKARWPGETPVAVMLGFPEQGPTLAERQDWAKKGIQSVYPGIRFEEFSAKNDVALGRQLATDLLTRYPTRRVIFWSNIDSVGLAVVAAIRDSNREADALVAATGGDRTVFPELRRRGSPMVGTFAFFPEYWAEDLLNLAVRVAHKEPVPERTTPRRELFLDAANIDKYYPA